MNYERNVRLNNIADSAQVGVTWDITEKSKGTIKGGVLKKDFESTTFTNYRGSTGSINFEHHFVTYASVFVVGERTVNEANLAGTRYFITTGAFGELKYTLFTKLAAFVHGSYGLDEFSNPVPTQTVIREDKTRMAGGGSRYTIQNWLAIGNIRTTEKIFEFSG